ncbi:hypothetical protein PybrP1_009808 [[Pythium] brassicae (nom. inval.)]|nr:hypothetical protein PybrP1_009808 [[Pythium] brassicae (nom. inval.)]
MFRTKKRAAGSSSVAQRKRKEIDEDEDKDGGAEPVTAAAAVAIDDDVADAADEAAAEDALLARMRERRNARRNRPTASTTGASSTSAASAAIASATSGGRYQPPASTGGALSFEAEAKGSSRTSKSRIRPNLLAGEQQPADAADADADTSANAYSHEALAALRKQQNVLLSGASERDAKDASGDAAMDELEGATVVAGEEEEEDEAMAIDDSNAEPATEVAVEEEEEEEADDFIPLHSQLLQSRKKRSRVTFGVHAAAPRPAQTTEEEVDEDDEEERRWEADIMRRGGLRAPSNGAPAAGFHAAASAAAGNAHGYPTRRHVPTRSLADVLTKLQRSLDSARFETDRAERELARIEAETALIQESVSAQRAQLRVASDEFEYFQGVEDFVKGLSFCLRAKVREIDANEREVAALRVATIRSLRDADAQRAQAIAAALVAAGAITAAAGASGLQLFAASSDAHGLSRRSDASSSGVDSATAEALARGFVDRTPAIPQPPPDSAFDVFADAIDDMNSLAHVHARFEAWRVRFPSVYARCYCALALETLYAPYVRAELLFWDPLSVGAAPGAGAGPPWRLASFDWVRVLQARADTDDADDSGPVAALVRDVVLAKALSATTQYFDPFSALHTRSLCALLEEVGKRPTCAAVCAPMATRVATEAAAQFVAAAKLVPLVSLWELPSSGDGDGAGSAAAAVAADFAAYELGRFHALLDNALAFFVALPRDAAMDSGQSAGFRCVMQLLHQLLAYLSHCQRTQQTRLVARAAQTAAQLTASPFLQQLLASSSQEHELQHMQTMDVLPSIEGVVKLAYPLRALPSPPVNDVFTLGDGPCGGSAKQVLTLVLETPSSFESRVVFLYDAWAERMKFLQRHYKVRIAGLGVALSLWDVGGEDTEDRQPCVVVAEKDLLKRTLKHRVGIFQLPRGIRVDITFEEPQRVVGLDQLHYLAPKTVDTKDLRPALPSSAQEDPPPLPPPAAKPGRQLARGKRSLEAAAPAYKYTCLGDLVCGKAFVYGVVVNMSLPKRTRGSDYSMTVHVVDESCPQRCHALQVVIFFPKTELMPKVLYVGDVIRFHRLEVKRYLNNLQGVCHPKFTRHLVIREDPQTGELQQHTCSDTWTFDDSDAARVREILHWSRQGLRDDTSFLPGYPQPPALLSDAVFVGAYVDIVVRVLHVSTPENRCPRVIVWDGSGSALPAAESRCAEVLQANAVAAPSHGVLREIVFDSCWELLQTFGFSKDLLLRHWCRFRNLNIADEDDQSLIALGSVWNSTVLRFREGASVMFVPECVQDVRERLALGAAASRLPASRVETTQCRPKAGGSESDSPVATQTMSTTTVRQTQTVVPEFIRRDVAVTTLRDVIRSHVVPRKFHCLARFAHLWPSDVTKLAKRQPGTDSTFVYSFVVRLEDDSDSIDVIVHGKDAEHFLHGIPPCDLSTSTSSRVVLEKRLAALLGSRQAQHCCVKAYAPPTASGSQSPAASVRYRLFDTLLQ